jgi:hypothetical protein
LIIKEKENKKINFYKTKIKMASSINNNIIGSIVNGRFKVLKSLGDGAQGEVFKVNDLKDENKM